MATETFPVKPKLRSTSNKTTPTPESKYWKSFKTHNPIEIQTTTTNFRITSLTFSPITPHDFATCHSASLSIYSGQTLNELSKITSFHDSTTCASFRCDGKLLAASDQTGSIHVFDPKAKNKRLRLLKGHSGPTQVVSYPKVSDKFHLFSGGDDSVVKYWDVATEKCVIDLFGSKDYVRCGDTSPVTDDVFVSGGYDHKLRIWDIRVKRGCGVLDMDCEKPIESVVYLPSGGLIATGSGNFVKIWDVIGGGRLLYSMENHNKTVMGVCLGKVGEENRVLSVGLDGFFKVFDYGKFKVTHSMRFPKALMSVAFSPDCSTRVIGATNGSLYVGRRKKGKAEEESGNFRKQLGFGVGDVEDEPRREVLRPSYFRYFHRGQNVKPSEGDYLVKKPKKVKMASYDKLLMKFRHKEAFVDVLNGKNPENVVAVIEELVARKKLMKCVSNLDVEELGLLLGFLQKYLTMPRFGRLLTRLVNKVIELRAEDIKASDELRGHIRNLKRGVEEEIRIKQSLLEIQGIISPIMRIAARR